MAPARRRWGRRPAPEIGTSGPTPPPSADARSSCWTFDGDVCARREGANPMKRILVAFDGGEPARHALTTAIDLAKRFNALISVVSVVPFHPGRVPMDPWDDQEVHAQELL